MEAPLEEPGEEEQQTEVPLGVPEVPDPQEVTLGVQMEVPAEELGPTAVPEMVPGPEEVPVEAQAGTAFGEQPEVL